jgi:hypothetical protein
MASNDMNSWDEDPERLLRQRWQQTFSEFEVQSRPSVRRRILSQITVQNRPKPTTWLVGGVLLLLFSAVLVYTIRRGDRTESDQVSRANVRLTPATRAEGVTARRPANSARRATSSEPFETGLLVNGAVVEQRLMIHQSTLSSKKTDAVKGSFRRHMRSANRLHLRVKSKLPLADSYAIGRPFVKKGRFSGNRFSHALLPAVEVSNRQRAEGLMKQTDSVNRNHIIANHELGGLPAPAASPVVLAQLEIPVLSFLPSSLRALPNRLPMQQSVLPSATNAEKRFRQHRQWFVETVPLSSFQWMSTSSTSTAYLTQVNAPAAFSPATWGYQINGGVRWQNWQAYLSLGQLRRWAYYTVNENQYRMESSPTNTYQMVREKHVVAENVALSTIGGGISQYRFLGQGRYMVELGSQVVYSPTSGQILAGLRGGAGRRLPISRRLELQTGLMAEYGFTRLMSERQELVIHPIVVGVSIRIQPRLFLKER